MGGVKAGKPGPLLGRPTVHPVMLSTSKPAGPSLRAGEDVSPQPPLRISS